MRGPTCQKQIPRTGGAEASDFQRVSRAMLLRAAPHGALSGAAHVPGDKSISHRSLMLAAMAVGESRVEGLLEGDDVLATAGALRAMGVELERTAPGGWRVWGVGVGGLAEPSGVLDLGNAGTGARLLMGLLAGHGFTSFLSGDASLRSRPMRRVIEPLGRMGASFLSRSGGRLPLALTGRTDLLPIVHESPVASAQVKSAVLFAGLHAPGATTVVEQQASRDHSERMLGAMGAEVSVEPLAGGGGGGRRVTIRGQPELRPQSFLVPGDPSSAGFPAVAAAAAPGSAVRLEGVCLNPLRTGLYATLREMGARVEVERERSAGGEPVGDLLVRGGELEGVEVPAGRAPAMIDEYPILAVAAALARGTTVMRGLAELRVKESDRLATMADGLAACGVAVEVAGDDLIVHGGRKPAGGAVVDARLDHRIAMSFLILGGLAARPVTVAGAEAIETSFPGFPGLMNGLGAAIAPAPETAA
jgi:3-phosphoshikimate 1-carboxyvinyltransferase